MAPRILLIHDDAELLYQAQQALKSKYSITTCLDIQESISALETLETHASQLSQPSVDLIVSSVYFERAKSVLTVFDLLKWIKIKNSQVPVLLISFAPSQWALRMVETISQVGSILGASGHLVMENIEPVKFVELIDSYLPERTTLVSSAG